MRSGTGASALFWNCEKKMAAVGEEDLLILLSLDDDDLDREIIETVLVKEAEHVEVKDILSVLQRLSLSHEESESRSALK